jgi:hypothetical protein
VAEQKQDMAALASAATTVREAAERLNEAIAHAEAAGLNVDISATDNHISVQVTFTLATNLE